LLLLKPPEDFRRLGISVVSAYKIGAQDGRRSPTTRPAALARPKHRLFSQHRGWKQIA
jgi:hypothetical protein